MFTGIVTATGRIEAADQKGDLRLRIACGYASDDVALGASIACSGVCLTVVDKGDGWFAVDVSGETRARAAPRMWEPGGRLNLERALKVGDELGGHIVTGHVDGVAEVLSVERDGASVRLALAAPSDLASYLAVKGSVALDGVSLTVNAVESLPGGAVRFTVNIIPHTAAHTTFDSVEPGRKLNLEADILARYLGRMMELRDSPM